MYTYKLTISYDGTRYDGWQRQKNTSMTIQGKLEYFLGLFFNHPVKIDGAGRTDAGVHALNQTASFNTDEKADCNELFKFLARSLPKDIAVTAIEIIQGRFHARLNAKGKIYRYRIYTGTSSPVFTRNYVFHHPDSLDTDILSQVSKKFIGIHDFKAYCDNPHMKKSTVRTISDIKITNENGFIDITFTGDGFLYHMVRHLTGAMIYYASNPNLIIPDMFSFEKCPKEWPLAPAKGLTLVNVIY